MQNGTQRKLKAVRTDEAARILDIDFITLYRRIYRGDQAAKKQGNRWQVFLWEYTVPGSPPVYIALTRDEAIAQFGRDFVTVVGE